MKKSVIFLGFVMLLCSCGSTYMGNNAPLYYWGSIDANGASDYERLAYRDYKKQSPESMCALLVAYQDIVAHPGGTRMVPPPGVCAEYGYLLLQPETAINFMEHATDAQKKVFENPADYSAYFSSRGKELLQMEMELYPESQVYIGPLVKKLGK